MSPYGSPRRAVAWNPGPLYRTWTTSLLALGLLLALSVPSARAADLRAHLDRSAVGLDETFNLSIAADGNGSSGRPDLAPLKKDFQVLGTAQSQRLDIVNGQVSARLEWTITLAPRTPGEFTIPPIRVGEDSTQPLHVKVLPGGAGTAAMPGGRVPVALEAEVDDRRPYVQAEVVYTLRLYYGDGLRQGSLADPQVPNAIVERLGRDSRYDKLRDGRTYHVIERRYAVFPQASGPLKIPPILFSGQMAEARPSSVPDRFFNGFGGPNPLDRLFETLRPVRAHSPEIGLEVRPSPAQATAGTWLPAQSLTVSESWSPDPPQFRVGEPVTRTITLLARGLSASQLPDLTLKDSPSMKVYPDEPAINDQSPGMFLLGKRVEKFALVPTQAGKFSLPAIRVPWWDVATDQPQEAVLSARTIEVLAAPPGQVANGSPPSPAAAAPGVPAAMPMAPAPAVSIRPGAPATGEGRGSGELPWAWLTAALLVAWLSTLGLWWRARRQRLGRQPSPPARKATGASAPLRDLDRACRANDPQAARAAILAWSAARWAEHPPRGLGELAVRLQRQESRAALQGLDRLLYRGRSERWDGKAFWSSIAGELQERRRDSEGRRGSGLLPDLYPQC